VAYVFSVVNLPFLLLIRVFLSSFVVALLGLFGFGLILASGQLNAIIGRRLAEDSLEDPVEMGERLEPYFKSDLADAQVRVEQQVLGPLNAQTRQVIGEVDAGYLAEHFAEIKAAGVYGFGDLGQGDVLGLVFLNEFLGFGDNGRLGIFLTDQELVTDDCEVLSKNCKEFGHVFVFAGRDGAGCKVGRAHLVLRGIDASFIH